MRRTEDVEACHERASFGLVDRCDFVTVSWGLVAEKWRDEDYLLPAREDGRRLSWLPKF